ncbi:hypothetical protein CSE45_0483 [Citreicella sp. SE45]|nr:hypothetical protein CSE45_0483 [Citreicella sp. SE45]NVK60636.1 hypothetical protein [Paracoccaceae bacterium]
MPRFTASDATKSYGSGFDHVALRDAFADFRSWWDRNRLTGTARRDDPEITPSLPMAA